MGTEVRYMMPAETHSMILKIRKGAVVVKTNHKLPPSTNTDPRRSANPAESDDDPDDAEEEVALYQEVSAFGEIISWAHESLPDQTADAHIKGIEEWVQFAEKVSGRRYHFQVSAD